MPQKSIQIFYALFLTQQTTEGVRLNNRLNIFTNELGQPSFSPYSFS